MGLFIPYPPQERLQVRRSTGAPDTRAVARVTCTVYTVYIHWKTHVEVTWFRCTLALN